MAQLMTWAGYESKPSRNEDTWAKAKSIAHSAGSMTLDVLKELLAQLAAAAAGKWMGCRDRNGCKQDPTWTPICRKAGQNALGDCVDSSITVRSREL